MSEESPKYIIRVGHKYYGQSDGPLVTRQVDASRLHRGYAYYVATTKFYEQFCQGNAKVLKLKPKANKYVAALENILVANWPSCWTLTEYIERVLRGEP